MNVTISQPSQPPPPVSQPSMASPKPAGVSTETARRMVAMMNPQQLAYLQQLYNKHKEEQEQKRKAEEEAKAKEQQQSILDLLIKQTPITVDVMRSSTSPESQMSAGSCSSVGNSLEEEPGITVKDVVIGKLKSHFKAAIPHDINRHYRPRGPRDRCFFDNHIFVFDKLSYDGKKKFYRCERRNTCPARIHTPFDSERVIHRVQMHNHFEPTDIAHFDIDFGRVRSGFIMPIAAKHNSRQATPSSSLLTPNSELEYDLSEKEPTPMDILSQMVQQEQRRPINFRLPDNFHRMGPKELGDIDMALTRFLFQNTHLRQEFMTKKTGALPFFFENAKKEDLVLFVADFNKENACFEMVTVKQRNEESIRAAIEEHLQVKSSRPLKMNISAKINVPLSQQMIDQWKTEEFIRIDTSKPNAWNIHHVTSTN